MGWRQKHFQLAGIDGQSVGFNPMKRFLSAASHRVTGLLSTRAAAPKVAVVPGKFLEYKAREAGRCERLNSVWVSATMTVSGVAKNFAQAAKWYRKAAEQNYAPAQFNLGYCYANGQGVGKGQSGGGEVVSHGPPSRITSRLQSNLGWCYDNGQGRGEGLRRRR